MFYPLKLVREMVSIKDDGTPTETIEATYPQIEIPKLEGKKFTK
jgi:hypothetical protein